MSRAPRRTAMILAVAVLVLGGCVAPGPGRSALPAAVTTDAQAIPDSLRVITFNIRMIREPDRSLERWLARREQVARLIRALDPDIIALQEVEDRRVWPSADTQLRYLRERLPGYEFACISEPGQLARQPIAFDPARFTLADEGSIVFRGDPAAGENADPRELRFASWARLRDQDGRTLTAVNVHWDHLSGTSRRLSAGLTADFVERAQAAGDTVIVLGDFNAFERSASVRTLLDTGLRHALDRSATGSYHFFTGVTLWPRIDHILIDSTLESLGGGLVYARDDSGYPSDHFPAVATLRWR